MDPPPPSIPYNCEKYGTLASIPNLQRWNCCPLRSLHCYPKIWWPWTSLHYYHKNDNYINILTSAVLNYTATLPVLLVINLLNIFDDNICLSNWCYTLFIVCAFVVKLKESCNQIYIQLCSAPGSTISSTIV